MIRWCAPEDFDRLHAVINAAAEAYRGIIPADRWHEPYMPVDELKAEIVAGVRFLGFVQEGILAGAMGLQDVAPPSARPVALIRHAYVDPALQGRGIGGALIRALRAETPRPLLVGTWAAATWAIRFYQARGFTLTDAEEKNALLRTYWSIPARQVETSVVLADARWRDGT